MMMMIFFTKQSSANSCFFGSDSLEAYDAVYIFNFIHHVYGSNLKKQKHNKTKQQTAHIDRTNISNVTDCIVTP